MQGLRRLKPTNAMLPSLLALRGMLAQGLEAGAPPKPPLYVGKTQRSFASDPDSIGIPAGAQVGDLLLMVTNTDLTTGFGPTNRSGWSLLDTLTTVTGYQQTVWTKIITLADLIASSFQVANTHAGNGVTCVLVYRNVGGIDVRGKSSNSSGTPMDFSFSPAVGSPAKGILVSSFNRLGDGTGWGVAGKWSSYASTRASFNGTGFYCFVADALTYPPVPAYDGSTFTLDVPAGGDNGAQFMALV